MNRLPEGSDRNLGVNVTTGAMRELLGPQGYEETLASNVMARQMAQTEGQAAETEREAEESVSVLEAMRDKEDRTAALSELPPSLRAREAAASGFARGNEGDLEAANKYFDLAFSAVDSAWDVRGEHTSMAAVVTEVCEDSGAGRSRIGAAPRATSGRLFGSGHRHAGGGASKRRRGNRDCNRPRQ